MTLPFVLGAAYVVNLPGKDGKLSPLVFMILIFLANSIRREIFKVKKPKDYDKYLKPVAMMALFFAILLGYGLIGFGFIDTLTR